MKLNKIQYNQSEYSINSSVYNNVQYGEYYSLFSEVESTRVRDNFRKTWEKLFDIQLVIKNEIR